MKELNDYFQNPWEVDKGGWRASGERERERRWQTKKQSSFHQQVT